MGSGLKIKEFIKGIRTCKNQKEENIIVNKECAKIRTAFKSGDTKNKHRNVAKLIYMHILGFKVDFGHMECLTLLASNKFICKRIGYLGCMQFLKENKDVFLLLTNSIKTDLRSTNQHVCGLAINALASLANEEMVKYLSSDINDILSFSNPSLKKLAVLCAAR